MKQVLFVFVLQLARLPLPKLRLPLLKDERNLKRRRFYKLATLFDVLLHRRSRRVGLGMTIPAGPFQYNSPHKPVPLTEDEEAALAFAACGVTGYALADLSYGKNQGGSMLAGRLGRTIASPDAVNATSVLVT